MVILYNEKKDCCACSACMNICPTKAITMKPDENGYIFPIIDNNSCIECGTCKKVCAFQNTPVSGKEPLATYVAINKNKDVLLSSSSGGLFGALSSIVFEKKGVVFGCAYNRNMEPEHICVDNLLDMKKIQGSKYVQSSINTSYAEAERYLKDGSYVLFTGTPCQIAALKSYLGKDYNNLITADLICHGVPSVEFFKGYIQYLEHKLKGKVKDLKFRDKSKGWGYAGKVVYQKNNKILKRVIIPITSYYYSYFLNGDTYRECCYECKYACGSREGDYTMGDYWGIQKAHPEIKTRNGVSVFLVNSERGMALVGELSGYLDLTASTFEKARKENGQLNKPTTRSECRNKILKKWREEGYQGIANGYLSANKKRIIALGFKMLIPLKIKRFIKKVILYR
jgi:coenzyme F420-reducing hydrogenase beta subunit